MERPGLRAKCECGQVEVLIPLAPIVRGRSETVWDIVNSCCGKLKISVIDPVEAANMVSETG